MSLPRPTFINTADGFIILRTPALMKLEGLDEHEMLDKLCELNVKEQVTNVCNTSIVQKIWENGGELTVHGWIYDINNGLLRDLGTDDQTTSF